MSHASQIHLSRKEIETIVDGVRPDTIPVAAWNAAPDAEPVDAQVIAVFADGSCLIITGLCEDGPCHVHAEDAVPTEGE